MSTVRALTSQGNIFRVFRSELEEVDSDDNNDDRRRRRRRQRVREYAYEHEAGEGRRRSGRTGRSQTTRRSFWYHQLVFPSERRRRRARESGTGTRTRRIAVGSIRVRARVDKNFIPENEGEKRRVHTTVESGSCDSEHASLTEKHRPRRHARERARISMRSTAGAFQ